MFTVVMLMSASLQNHICVYCNAWTYVRVG